MRAYVYMRTFGSPSKSVGTSDTRSMQCAHTRVDMLEGGCQDKDMGGIRDNLCTAACTYCTTSPGPTWKVDDRRNA